jgi:hypothetical protein
MCGGGGGSGGGDSAGMGMDDSVADQSATSGDTSSVGDDPSGPNDPGVGPGIGGDDAMSASNQATDIAGAVATGFSTASQANADNQNASMNQSLADTMSLANNPVGITSIAPTNAIDPYGINQTVAQNTAQNIGLANMANFGLSPNAVNSIGIAPNQYSKDSVTGFGLQNVGKDVSDITTADQMTTMSNTINNPLSNMLTTLGFPTTQNQINMGLTPSYSKGQITGATGYGIGMGSPTGSVPGYDVFSGTQPSVDYGNYGDIGGNESDGQQIIRRNPSDPVQDDPTDPILSDELASDYLQNPYYLYSGIGNQYQPYGYAQNTLVDLLRTRNMTQPQQRAANLGLFGNPGDFS